MDIVQILIGGSVTLAGAVLVQLFVVPRAQARTRGRERWENDVDKLVALLEEELPRALNEYKWATREKFEARRWRGMEGINERRLDELMRASERRTRETDEAVGYQMARLTALVRRVSRINSDAAYWREATLNHHALQIAAFDVTEAFLDAGDPAEAEWRQRWEQAWSALDTALDKMLDKVNQVAVRIPMKPPPRPPWVRRARHRLKVLIRPRRLSTSRPDTAGTP